jgi:uncharacterized protein YllA (UPF0747 family)
MEEVTKEEYLEAVRDGASDAFEEGIGSSYSLIEAITDGVERTADGWIKGLVIGAIAEGVERAISHTIREEMIQAIKDELMKGEKPCKS